MNKERLAACPCLPILEGMSWLRAWGRRRRRRDYQPIERANYNTATLYLLAAGARVIISIFCSAQTDVTGGRMASHAALPRPGQRAIAWYAMCHSHSHWIGDV
jgi:hypothetical protein